MPFTYANKGFRLHLMSANYVEALGERKTLTVVEKLGAPYCIIGIHMKLRKRLNGLE